MLRKSTLLGLAASAALSLVALSPVTASAHWSGGHGWGGHGHYHFYRHYGWHRPVIYTRPVVYAAARPVVASPGPCTCLSKEYTPEGAVLFKDRCTNEVAVNPPPAPPPQQTGELAPQQQPLAK